MTRREYALTAAKIAGYHADAKMFTRLIIECRVARPVMNAAWVAGERARQAGVRCGCRDCNPQETPWSPGTSNRAAPAPETLPRASQAPLGAFQ